jgi:hypothetical protein
MNKIVPTATSPAFGIIAPTQYLFPYALESKFHLVLAHLVDTDENYAAFYADRSVAGDFIICDNGAFELGKSYEPDKLIELGKKCGADALVLPDYPLAHHDRTIEAAIKYIPVFKQAGFKTMFVPQSETGDWDGWLEAYKFAAMNTDVDIIGMSILGIPNALPHIHKAYARVVATQMLIYDNEFAFDKHHHYLGLNSGPALEIPSLRKMGALTTCDSSGPVWAAICGTEYSLNTDSLMPCAKISKHVDFSYPRTRDKNVYRMINRNVELTLNLFKPEENQ